MASLEYQKKKREEKKALCIAYLGGKCAECGSIDALEFDHIDPKTKVFRIANGFTFAWERLKTELDKCQLLCAECHDRKSILDRGTNPAKGTHGTLSAFRYCDCMECRQAKRDYQREYMRSWRKRSER